MIDEYKLVYYAFTISGVSYTDTLYSRYSWLIENIDNLETYTFQDVTRHMNEQYVNHYDSEKELFYLDERNENAYFPKKLNHSKWQAASDYMLAKHFVLKEREEAERPMGKHKIVLEIEDLFPQRYEVFRKVGHGSTKWVPISEKNYIENRKLYMYVNNGHYRVSIYYKHQMPKHYYYHVENGECIEVNDRKL